MTSTYFTIPKKNWKITLWDRICFLFVRTQKAVDHAEGITTLYKKFNEKIYIVGQRKHTGGVRDEK